MRKVVLCGAALWVSACGGDGEGNAGAFVEGSEDPFCQEVMPRVAAYVEEAAARYPTQDDERYGGTVVVGSIGELPEGMMAAAMSDYAAVQHHQFVNLMTLIDYDEDALPRPYLAESFEMAEDGSSVTFRLRRDVFWHDGEPTDAHDVAFTYEVVTDPVTAYPNASFFDRYVKGPEGVEVIDDHTVTIRMEPHSEALDPFRSLGILPEHLLGDVPRDQLAQHPYGTQCPVGNGPFVFAEHRAQDRWIFEANPGFSASLGGRPFVDRYVLRVIPEQTTLLTELLTENVDVFIQPHPTQAREIEESDGPIELIRVPSRQYVMVVWNARREVLADARVRRALTMGTDRARIVEALLQGYGTVANAGVPAFHWAYDADAVAVPYDPDGAASLLTEAGWVDRDGDGVRENASGAPLSISIKYPPGNELRRNISEIMQAQLADVGVQIRLQAIEWTTMLEQVTEPSLRDFDGAAMGWTVEYRIDDTDLFHSERIDQPLAMAGISNPRIDELLEAISVESDREVARGLWSEYQAAMLEEHPYTFLYFPERLVGINERVMGEVMDTRGEWLNIREWYLDPESR